MNGNDPAKVGDTLRYQVSLTNTGSDPADNSVLTDVVPPNTTFVPGSLVLETNPGSTAGLNLTDAVGDDQAEYLPGTRTVRFRVGQSATASAGGSVGINQTVTIRFRVTLDRAAAGTAVPNVANLAYRARTIAKDFTFVGNQVTTPVAQIADLAVTKTSDPATQTAGSTVIYRITATNNGPNAATNVLLTDNLPAGVSFVSASPPAGTTCTNHGQTVSCTAAALPNGGSVPVPIAVTITPGTAAGTQLTDIATVSSDTGDDVPTNNTANATTTVTTSADLGLTKTISPNPAPAGSNVTYTLTAHNNGPSTAAGVVVTDALPLGLNYVTSTPAGICTNDNGTVSCSLGSLGPNQSSAVTITAAISSNFAAGTINNTATVKSSTPDPDNENNTASVPVAVTASADLAVTKTGSDPTVTAGGPVTYTIRVTNNGPSDAQGVTVTDPAVTGLTIQSAAASQGSCTVVANAVSCPVGTIGNGSSVVVTVRALVDPARTAAVTNAATATSTTTDPAPGNNTCDGDGSGERQRRSRTHQDVEPADHHTRRPAHLHPHRQ